MAKKFFGDTSDDMKAESTTTKDASDKPTLKSLSDEVKKELHSSLSFWLNRSGIAGASADALHEELRGALGQEPSVQVIQISA